MNAIIGRHSSQEVMALQIAEESVVNCLGFHFTIQKPMVDVSEIT